MRLPEPISLLRNVVLATVMQCMLSASASTAVANPINQELYERSDGSGTPDVTNGRSG